MTLYLVLETGPQLTFALGLPGARSTGVSISGCGHGLALVSKQHLIKADHDGLEAPSGKAALTRGCDTVTQ